MLMTTHNIHNETRSSANALASRFTAAGQSELSAAARKTQSLETGRTPSRLTATAVVAAAAVGVVVVAEVEAGHQVLPTLLKHGKVEEVEMAANDPQIHKVAHSSFLHLSAHTAAWVAEAAAGEVV